MVSYSSTFIIFFVIVAIALAILIAPRFRQKKKVEDPRRYLTPNDTNYNIASMIDPEVIARATPAEAAEILKKADRGELSSLTNEDFFRLKEKVKGEA